MSLQVNLSSQDIAQAYQDIVDSRGIDWVIFTYEKGTNDLKVQATGGGGLSEMVEELSDGRIQYAFARVTDPNSKLPKLVQINWCGDGVPEFKKGLFHTHSAAVSKFLRGTHVVIHARNETDVLPSVIMSKISAASGTKYNAHQEPTRSSGRPTPASANPAPLGSASAVTIPRSPAALVRDPAAADPPPAATISAKYERPTPTVPLTQIVTNPAPISSSFNIGSHAPTNLVQQDNVTPIGSTYMPISLPPPKKLKNPFAAMEAQLQQEQSANPQPVKIGLTWNDRKVLAKAQAATEEARSKAAGAALQVASSTVPDLTKRNPVLTIANDTMSSSDAVIPAVQGRGSKPEPTEIFVSDQVDVSSAISYSISASLPDPASATEEEVEYQTIPSSPPLPPPPPPPPPPLLPAMSSHPPTSAHSPTLTLLHSPLALLVQGMASDEHEQPVPLAQLSDSVETGHSICVRALYDYEAGEPNEMNLVEGEVIHQVEQLDEGWWNGVSIDGLKSGLFPANFVEIIKSSEFQAVTEQLAGLEFMEVLTAVALYDYDQCEENEISFREGEQITNIEMASEDWWQGKNAEGNTGLFPANYVQLQE